MKFFFENPPPSPLENPRSASVYRYTSCKLAFVLLYTHKFFENLHKFSVQFLENPPPLEKILDPPLHIDIQVINLLSYLCILISWHVLYLQACFWYMEGSAALRRSCLLFKAVFFNDPSKISIDKHFFYLDCLNFK